MSVRWVQQGYVQTGLFCSIQGKSPICVLRCSCNSPCKGAMQQIGNTGAALGTMVSFHSISLQLLYVHVGIDHRYPHVHCNLVSNWAPQHTGCCYHRRLCVDFSHLMGSNWLGKIRRYQVFHSHTGT